MQTALQLYSAQIEFFLTTRCLVYVVFLHAFIMSVILLTCGISVMFKHFHSVEIRCEENLSADQL